MAKGPKINIGVEGNESELQRLTAQAKELQKAVRDVDKEITKVAKKGEKVSEDLLKRQREAQTALGKANYAINRHKQALSDRARYRIDNIQDAGQLVGDSFDPLKNLRSSIKNTLSKTGFGKKAMDWLSKPGTQQMLGNFGVAGGIAYTGYIAGKAFVNALGRNMEAEAVQRSIDIARYRGEDTDMLKKQHRRALVDGRSGYRALDTLREIPVLGGIIGGRLDSIKNIDAWMNGVDDTTLSREKFSKLAEEERLSEEQAKKLRYKAELEADGNSVVTLARRKIRQMFGDNIATQSGEYEKKVLEKSKEMIDFARTLEKEGFRLISENNFTMAESAFKQSASTLGKDTWKNPMVEWASQDAARQAQITYAKSQNPLPALRIGM